MPTWAVVELAVVFAAIFIAALVDKHINGGCRRINFEIDSEGFTKRPGSD